VEGRNHLASVEGRLYRNDGKGWRLVCDSSEGGRRNWGLQATSLSWVAFDGEGRTHLLSDTLGVVRREGARWARLTPGWPDHSFTRCLHSTAAGLVAIGLYDGGVLLIERKSSRARRVVLREAGRGGKP